MGFNAPPAHAPSLLSSPPLEGARARWLDRDVASLLRGSAVTHAERPALVTNDASWSYCELFTRAHRISRAIRAARALGPADADGVPRGAIMGSRSARSFAGLLGTILSGATYVPLNPKFPSGRTIEMIRRARARTVVLEEEHLGHLADVLEGDGAPLAVLVLGAADVSTWASRFPAHTLIAVPDADGGDDGADVARDVACNFTGETPLYIMFTSGSTGTPKGVCVTHRNVVACLAYLADRYGIGPDDRFSQNFELTFDLSVFDVFLPWLSGASLHVPPRGQQPAPGRFVAERALTVWFSVPSMALFMERFRQVKPGAFPTLRHSLFCGERLPLRVAEAWAEAAPASQVENLYGPTEATIACTLHRLDGARTGAIAQLGTVPIGVPFASMRAAIVTEEGALAAAGEPGELWVAGPQVAEGYLDDPEKTDARFVRPRWDDAGDRWYRTGDLARIVEGELVHLGRADDQVKIRGYRVELGEIEAAIRAHVGTESVSVVATAASDAEPAKLVAFVAGARFDELDVKAALTTRLPDYMQPAEVRAVNALPLNSNGKVDKKALLQSIGGT